MSAKGTGVTVKAGATHEAASVACGRVGSCTAARCNEHPIVKTKPTDPDIGRTAPAATAIPRTLRAAGATSVEATRTTHVDAADRTGAPDIEMNWLPRRYGQRRLHPPTTTTRPPMRGNTVNRPIGSLGTPRINGDRGDTGRHNPELRCATVAKADLLDGRRRIHLQGSHQHGRCHEHNSAAPPRTKAQAAQ